jgi:phosphocarrier protein
MSFEDTFQIVNELGLHARAAAKIVECAGRYQSDVWLVKDGHRANAKSVMGMLLLCGQRGSKLKVTATGPDAEQAVHAIGTLISSRFGEER